MAKQEKPRSIVILTGAGVSAESGLGTFRDKDGTWTRVDLREVATPEGYARNPMKVHEFYNKRRRDAQTATPNAAHLALARFEREFLARDKGNSFLLVTQNVDDLHDRAGSKQLLHMHGALLEVFCTRCNHETRWTADVSTATNCPKCKRAGGVRPDIVWFGEMPYEMEAIEKALAKCDLFISIGTSGAVYPAAGFVALANDAGAHTVELNLEPSDGADQFAETINGPATEIVPAFVKRILGEA